MYKKMSSCLVLMLLSFGVVAQTDNQETTDQRKVLIEHYKHFGELPAAKKIRIINLYGSVTSRTTTYDHVELSGVIQKIGQNWSTHNIDIRDNQGVTEVVVSYPDGNIDEQGRLTGRFDMGVWVPSYLTVEVVTDFGDIKVKKSGSDVIAKSTSGKISIGTTGQVSAQSKSGNVSVNLKGNAYSKPMTISSQTGDVTVSISERANLSLSAKADKIKANNFTTHKNVSVNKLSETQLLARLGSTGPDLQLAAAQGELSVSVAKGNYNKHAMPAKLLRKSNQ